MKADITEDRILGGRVHLRQPSNGYRAAIDPIFLAAAVNLEPADRVLDAGTGTGAAALCLAARVADCGIVGVEREAEAAGLARDNVAANGFGERIAIVEADFRAYAAAHPGRFDRVMMNPPYHQSGRHSSSPHPGKAVAHGEEGLDLAGWIGSAATVLAKGGTLTLIHRADRIASLLAAIEHAFGAVTIFPLWPRAGTDAKRIILQAVKGRRTLPRLMPGLVLHEADGRYTAQAEAILREAAPLDLGALDLRDGRTKVSR